MFFYIFDFHLFGFLLQGSAHIGWGVGTSELTPFTGLPGVNTLLAEDFIWLKELLDQARPYTAVTHCLCQITPWSPLVSVACRMPAAEHAPAFHVQHFLAVLVEHFPGRAHQTHIGFAAHGPRFGDEVLKMEGIARLDRLHPFHVFQTWRAQAGRLVQKICHHQPHGHGAGVPTAGTQAAKNGSFGGFLIEVESLGVKLAGKSQDLFFCGCDRAQVTHLAWLQILPVISNGHQRPPDTSRKLIVV